MAEGDLKTRRLLRTIVHTAAGSSSAGSDGWTTLRGQMSSALLAEQQARGERTHAQEIEALLDFDRLSHSSTAVPVLTRCTASTGTGSPGSTAESDNNMTGERGASPEQENQPAPTTVSTTQLGSSMFHHSFEGLIQGSGPNYSQWSVGNRHG